MRQKTSRRRFLERALAGAASAAASGLAAAGTRRQTVPEPERERLERLANFYGGELGNLRKTGR